MMPSMMRNNHRQQAPKIIASLLAASVCCCLLLPTPSGTTKLAVAAPQLSYANPPEAESLVRPADADPNIREDFDQLAQDEAATQEADQGYDELTRRFDLRQANASAPIPAKNGTVATLSPIKTTVKPTAKPPPKPGQTAKQSCGNIVIITLDPKNTTAYVASTSAQKFIDDLVESRQRPGSWLLWICVSVALVAVFALLIPMTLYLFMTRGRNSGMTHVSQINLEDGPDREKRRVQPSGAVKVQVESPSHMSDAFGPEHGANSPTAGTYSYNVKPQAKAKGVR